MLKGFRTILLNAGIVAGTAGLNYLGNYDWTAHVGAVGALGIVSGLNILMRFLTTTAVGKAE
jgi:hypothetical protein